MNGDINEPPATLEVRTVNLVSTDEIVIYARLPGGFELEVAKISGYDRVVADSIWIDWDRVEASLRKRPKLGGPA